MTFLTNGAVLIYAVFDADGCECEDLAGVFSTQELADAFAAPLKAEVDADHARRTAEWGREPRIRRTISVRALTLDSPEEQP